MKKHSYPRLTLPFFVSLLLFSCTGEETMESPLTNVEDESKDDPSVTSSSGNISTITFDELKNEIQKSKNYGELAGRFDINANFAEKGSKNHDSDYIIDTEHINKMEGNGKVSYTMRVENAEGIQNVVIEPHENDSLEIKLYTYDFFEEIVVDDEYVTLGNLTVRSIYKDDIVTLTSNGCYPVTFGFPYPCNGTLGNGDPANHYPGDNCSANQQPGYLWYTTTVCPGSGGGQNPLMLPRECTALQCAPVEAWGGGGNTGGGGSPGGGGFGDGTTPIIDEDGNSIFELYLEAAVSLLDNRLGLNFLEENWLKFNNVKMQEIIDFLYRNDWSSYSKGYAKKLIDGYRKGTVISEYPFVKYPDNKSAQYKSDYPKLTEYLKNQLPNVANISKITDAIHEFTQLPLDQIKNDLQWGEGPIVEIVQLDNYPDCNTCSEDTAGHFDKTIPDRVFLDIDWVNCIESGCDLLEPELEVDLDALIFWIGTTILHEYVHYGDFTQGFEYPGEEGRRFEIQAYGNNIQPDNARFYLNKIEN